jgi:hypothetical protein
MQPQQSTPGGAYAVIVPEAFLARFLRFPRTVDRSSTPRMPSLAVGLRINDQSRSEELLVTSCKTISQTTSKVVISVSE